MDTAATPNPAKATLSLADLQLMRAILELSGAVVSLLGAVRVLSLHAPPDAQADVVEKAIVVDTRVKAAVDKIIELTA